VQVDSSRHAIEDRLAATLDELASVSAELRSSQQQVRS
jgi:hypothetical protein